MKKIYSGIWLDFSNSRIAILLLSALSAVTFIGHEATNARALFGEVLKCKAMNVLIKRNSLNLSATFFDDFPCRGLFDWNHKTAIFYLF